MHNVVVIEETAAILTKHLDNTLVRLQRPPTMSQRRVVWEVQSTNGGGLCDGLDYNYKVALFSGDSKLQQIILDQLYATDRKV